MIPETVPGYTNKHSKAIHLDTYHGLGWDFMELNQPVADGFMRVSDMRADVAITQKPQDRVRDYDEIGYVRVAKLLKLPRLDFWHNGNGLVQTRIENDVWYIAINDQELADKVARSEGNNRKFNERFTDAFRNEVNHGLTTCLRREKLLNSGKYNLGFLAAYFGSLKFDLVFGSALLTKAIFDNNLTLAEIAVLLAAMGNVVYNTGNLFGTAITYFYQRLYGHSDSINPNTPDFKDSFIKHSLLEFVMPPVPIDRIIRGSRYLGQHGDNLINYAK